MSDEQESLINKDRFLYHVERHLGSTLTVSELIGILERYPKDMKVMLTWESTVECLTEENIYEAYTGTLYLDADCNFYKKEFEKKI